MKKNMWIVIIVVCILVIFFLWVILKNSQVTMAKVCFGDSCFTAEVADTFLKQQKGLMFREGLPKNRGMLFVFGREANYSFWMKNTLIPLDIIWLNSDKKIVFIAENAQPCGKTCESINPQQNSLYVLELNGGVVHEKNISIGDQMDIF